MSERWVPVPGYEGRYLVSSDGRVRSLGLRKVVMAGERTRAGYIRVLLRHPSGDRHLSVHRLVLRAFVGECPPAYSEVRHLNGRRDDNRLANLAWGSRQQNAADRKRHGNDWQLAKTSCPQGHPYDEANTYVDRINRRYCRRCGAARARERSARKRGVA